MSQFERNPLAAMFLSPPSRLFEYRRLSLLAVRFQPFFKVGDPALLGEQDRNEVGPHRIVMVLDSAGISKVGPVVETVV